MSAGIIKPFFHNNRTYVDFAGWLVTPKPE